jgi:hypothetical protein
MKKLAYQWVGNMVNLALTKKLLKLTLTGSTLDPMKHQRLDYHNIYVVDKNNINIDGSMVKQGNFIVVKASIRYWENPPRMEHIFSL